MYVFDVVKFMKDCEKHNWSSGLIAMNLSWANECHNQPVDMFKELWGYCKGYEVHIDWCREV